MKKLLSLILVLGMVSLASAGLYTLSLDGQVITAARGEQVSFDILSAQELPPFSGGQWLVVTDAGSLSFTPVIGTVIGDNVGGSRYTADKDGKYGSFFNLSLAPLPAGAVGISCVLTVANAGVVELYAPAGESGDTGPLLSSFTVVPEPASMLLLGLGGLFLRRRK